MTNAMGERNERTRRRGRGTSGSERPFATHAVSYLRVSSDEQAEKRTPDAQRHSIDEYAGLHGLTLCGVYSDEGVSGAVPLDERPAGQRLLAAAEDPSRAFGVVIVAALDRLGRDAVETLLAERRLKALGLEVRYVRETFDDTPAGDFQKTVMSAVAQLERALIAQRMSEGRKRSVRDNGKYLASMPPFGYDRFDGKLVINEEQAKVVREMFRLCVEDDLGVQAIARRLDEMGVAPPLKNGHVNRRGRYGWSYGTVSNMLHAERYVGRGSYGGVPMECPAIIDEDALAAAQGAMRRRRSAALRTRSKRHYWLTDYLRCRQCGSKCVGFTHTQGRTGRRIALYECQVARRHGVAKTGHAPRTWRVRAADAEGPVKTGVLDLLSEPERVAGWLDTHVEEALSEIEGADERVRAAELHLTDLDEQQQRVMAGWTRGWLADQQADDERRRIASERREAEAVLAKASAAHERADEDRWLVESFKDIAASLPFNPEVFDARTGEVVERAPDDWREALRALGATAWVEADGGITMEGVTVSPTT